MKNLFLISIFLLASVTVRAEDPSLPSTAFTRTLLRAPTAAAARTVLGVSGGATNGVPLSSFVTTYLSTNGGLIDFNAAVWIRVTNAATAVANTYSNANTIQNLGDGAQLYKTKTSAGTFQFRTFTNSAEINWTQNANDISGALATDSLGSNKFTASTRAWIVSVGTSGGGIPTLDGKGSNTFLRWPQLEFGTVYLNDATTYTPSKTNVLVECYTPNNDLDVTLEEGASVTNSRLISFNKVTSANTVTIAPSTGEFINGVTDATVTLRNAGDSVTFRATTGAGNIGNIGWWIVSSVNSQQKIGNLENFTYTSDGDTEAQVSSGVGVVTIRISGSAANDSHTLLFPPNPEPGDKINFRNVLTGAMQITLKTNGLGNVKIENSTSTGLNNPGEGKSFFYDNSTSPAHWWLF